jgi:DNA-binding NarL/FixJ family response regulator
MRIRCAMPDEAMTDTTVGSLRVIVADDHAVVRQGLVSLLSDESDIEVLGTAADGREALSLLREHKPDLALLDITMPEMSGLEVARVAAEECPDTRVLILTMHEEEAFFFAALRAGASGYLLKGSQGEDVVAAIRAVCQGGIVLPPSLAPAIVKDFLARHAPPAELDELTPREVEIVSLIARGLTGSEIAERLMVSINTVKTHRSHIYSKLNIGDRSKLIEYAIRHGLLRG